MPSAHRLIEESARAAWHQATALLRAARADGGTPRADLDALADYEAEQRDGWLRASGRTRREEDRCRVVAAEIAATFAALDYGADEFGFDIPTDR